MFQSRNCFHLPSNLLFYGSATLILLMFFTDIAFTKDKNNFNSVTHKTKEAELKINELYCYSCDVMLDGEDCLNINKTQSKVNFTKKCANEDKCSVKRFSYTMSDKNSTSEKKLWSLQRNCTNSTSCTNSCIIIGERVKIHACETCCEGNLCNVSSEATHGGELNVFQLVIAYLIIRYNGFC